MLYTVAAIVREARVAMDQNRRDGELLSHADLDTLSLDEIIASKVEDAARLVVLAAPASVLEGGHTLAGCDIFFKHDGRAFLILPPDFLRLLMVRLSDWERPAVEAISADDPRYAMQFSRYAGIRGNPQKPVAAVVRRGEGLALELYGSRGPGATLEQGAYAAEPKVTEGSIDLPRRCHRPVVYMTAALALEALGAESAKALEARAAELLKDGGE